MKFSWIKTLLSLLLLVGLPVFIWAVLTQRIELRKKAEFTGPTLTMIPSAVVGTAGQEFTLGISLNTNTASVSGTELHLTYNPQIVHMEEFTPGSMLPVILSPAVIATDAGTVSVTLGAQPDSPATGSGIIGSVKFSLINDSPSAINIAPSTIVTAVGQSTNALVDATGTQINGGGTPTPTPTPTPVYTTSTLTPTPSPQPECGSCNSNTGCNSGLICQYVPTPTPNCSNGSSGECSMPANVPYQGCVKPDGSSICPIHTPTPSSYQSPTPSSPVSCSTLGQSSAYYFTQCGQNGYSGVCFNKYNSEYQGCSDANGAGCTYYNSNAENNIVCNSFSYIPYLTPTPTASYYPTPSCMRYQPAVSLLPNNQNGNPGQALTYIATITNTDSFGCNPATFALSTQVDTNFTAQQNATTITIPPTATTNVSFSVTSPLVDPYTDTRSVPVAFGATNTATNMSNHATAAYSLIKPQPQSLSFLIKLAGVNGGGAVDVGAALSAKFFLKNGSVISLSDPLPLTYVGNGVYSATGTLTNPFPPGTEFAVQVKVDKHLAARFCQKTGQTQPCDYSTWMTASDYNFDFSGRPMPAGDLDNNGQVDSADLKVFTDLWKKTPSQLTIDELKSADVNYNGSLDQMDFNEILKTLSVRYNE